MLKLAKIYNFGLGYFGELYIVEHLKYTFDKQLLHNFKNARLLDIKNIA